MTAASKNKKESDPTIHIGLSKDQKRKLEEMASSDRRKYPDFVRLLIEDEWNRRQNGKDANAAS